MSTNQFIPKMNAVKPEQTQSTAQSTAQVEKTDGMSGTLLKITQYLVVLMFGLLPIFFTPGLWASLGFDKVIFTVSLSVLILVLGGLMILRSPRVNTVLPMSLGLFWLMILMAVISGSLSGDAQDALRGSVMETQTAGFMAVLGLAMSVPLIMQGSKIMTIKSLALFAITACILLIYNVLRIFIGPDFLSFGSFPAVTVSPLGGFNDLAIFAGLMIIISLVTLVQLPLKTLLQYVITALVFFSLVALSAVNFFNIWLIVGFFALLMLVYVVSRDTLFSSDTPSVAHNSKSLVVATVLVCIFSATFIIAGDFAGNKVGKMTNINYVEVRPSLEATAGVAKAVYKEDLLFGVGPNRFADAWRLHKDPSINNTIFWNTDFNAGIGFMPTLFVTLGLLGGLLLVAFHIVFLYLGYRMLLRSSQKDSYWYYFGAVSFASACFIWGMTYLYVPGSAVLILGALFTGFTYVAAGALLPQSVRSVPLTVNRQRGFFMMALVIFIITASVTTLFSVGKQYVAESSFAKALGSNLTVDEVDQVAFTAYSMYPDDRFVNTRAQISLAKLNDLISEQNPTPEQQQQFLDTTQQAIVFAEEAVNKDITNPGNHAVLGAIYSTLALAGVEGALDRSRAALSDAETYDPQNPSYRLLSAQLAARIGDVETARSDIQSSLNLKRNYTQALYLSAQLDIADGNTESAIATTQAIIRLEPNNPTRYFQLGVLLTANGNNQGAVGAYESAVRLDPQYANARYLLALEYLALGQEEQALEHLRAVQQTNPENQQLTSLIQQVESGEYEVPTNQGFDTPVSETEPREDFEDTVVTDGEVNTDLVSPVNTVPEEEEAPVEPEAVEVIEPVEETTEEEAEEPSTEEIDQ